MATVLILWSLSKNVDVDGRLFYYCPEKIQAVRTLIDANAYTPVTDMGSDNDMPQYQLLSLTQGEEEVVVQRRR